MEHTEVLELITLPGRFGIKSKSSGKWFAYHYSSMAYARHIASNIESDWTDQIDRVNFCWPLPFMRVDHVEHAGQQFETSITKDSNAAG